jgi:hypothetical protein
MATGQRPAGETAAVPPGRGATGATASAVTVGSGTGSGSSAADTGTRPTRSPTPAGGGGPLIVIGASAFSPYPVPGGGFEANDAGGCVIHKFIYSSAGKYVGERQTPYC